MFMFNKTNMLRCYESITCVVNVELLLYGGSEITENGKKYDIEECSKANCEMW